MADNKTRTARINLLVPFVNHNYAKKCGAFFDRKNKVWYTYAGAANAKALVQFMSPQDKAVYGF